MFDVIRLLEDIKTGKGGAYHDGYRIGSRWTSHSKLYFRRNLQGNITALFNPNFDPKDRQGERYEEACEAGRLFQEAVNKLG